MISVLVGDAAVRLADLPERSFQCCVTSPPYYGLRDYGVAGQIGLEETPAAYVERLVDVFRGVRRALRDDGTLWLNLGDSYAGSWGSQGRDYSGVGVSALSARQVAASQRKASGTGKIRSDGVKAKDLLGIPWMVAFALRADGWWLRRDIIWSKPNPMPESVEDRPTTAHEYVFLLSKSDRYVYDGDAIREGLTESSIARLAQDVAGQMGSTRANGGAKTNGAMKAVSRRRGVPPYHAQYESSDQSGLDSVGRGEGRNSRSVWTISTRPFRDAHFATMPPALAERCIKAGSRSGDAVLDPFGGAGTTALAADRLQRHATIIEVNPTYAALARERLKKDAGMLAQVAP